MKRAAARNPPPAGGCCVGGWVRPLAAQTLAPGTRRGLARPMRDQTLRQFSRVVLHAVAARLQRRPVGAGRRPQSIAEVQAAVAGEHDRGALGAASAPGRSRLGDRPGHRSLHPGRRWPGRSPCEDPEMLPGQVRWPPRWMRRRACTRAQAEQFLAHAPAQVRGRGARSMIAAPPPIPRTR